MKFILALLLTAVLGFLAGLFLPWWSIAIVAFVVALLIPQNLILSFVSGMLGIFSLWAVLAIWIDLKNDSILSHRISELMKIGGSSVLLICVTALIGGIVGGFAALSGSSLRPVRRYRRP
jgi:hypothetical protein